MIEQYEETYMPQTTIKVDETPGLGVNEPLDQSLSIRGTSTIEDKKYYFANLDFDAAANVLTTCGLTSINTNDDGMKATSGRVTITKDGTYLILSTAVFNVFSTSGNERQVQIAINGTIGMRQVNPPRSSGWSYSNTQYATNLSEGDYIEIKVRQDSTTSLNDMDVSKMQVVEL